jgi:hypothetical protein
LIDFFLNGRRGKYAYAKDFTADDSHQATSVNGLGRLRGKLNSQIAHITYGRTNEDAEKIGTSELEQLFNLIEDELTNFENHLKEAYAPWQPVDRPAIKPGTLPNATNTSSVSGSFLCLRTQTTKTLGSQPLPLEADG